MSCDILYVLSAVPELCTLLLLHHNALQLIPASWNHFHPQSVNAHISNFSNVTFPIATNHRTPPFFLLHYIYTHPPLTVFTLPFIVHHLKTINSTSHHFHRLHHLFFFQINLSITLPKQNKKHNFLFLTMSLSLLSKLLTTIVLLATVLVADAQISACRQAYRECHFRFAKYPYLHKFDIMNKPNRAFTTRIITKKGGMDIGILNTNITAQFIFKNGPVDITNYGKPKFSPSHFKPFHVRGTKKSGIGHQTFTGNQAKVAMGKCIRVYFSHFQIRDHDVVSDNKNNVMMEKNKCVVFRA